MNIELSIVVNNHSVGLGEIHVATQKLVKMDKTCKLMLQNEPCIYDCTCCYIC